MESDGEIVYLQWEELRKLPACRKGVFNNAQKIASLARQTSKARPCGKRGDLLGVVESAFSACGKLL